MEASHFHPFQAKMMRSYLMLSKFAEALRENNGFVDVSNLFEKAVGLPVLVYESLIFASMARFISAGVDQLTKDSSLFAIQESWLSSTKIPEEQIGAFFRDMSFDVDELREKANDLSAGLADFTMWKDRPFFRDGGTLYPMDLSLVAEKFESGPFWRVNEYLPQNQRQKLHAFWGEVFEDYVNWIFGTTVDQNLNRFYASPMYESSPEMQVCDGLIISKGAAIFMEYKGNTFSAKSKYEANSDLLGVAIEEKFVGTESRPKGVRQLMNGIVSVFQRESQRAVRNVDLSRVDRVIPLLITRDDVGGAFGMNAYLNLRFQSLMGNKRRKIRKAVLPLFCIAAGDLEKLSAYLPDASLTEIIESRYRSDQALKTSFFAVDNPVIQSRGNRRPKIYMDANEEFKKIMVKILGVHDSQEVS
jgi:hypothetical protein